MIRALRAKSEMKRHLFLLCAVPLLSLGCSEPTGAPPNSTPTIDFPFDRLAVAKGDTVDFAVTVADRDAGDQLNVTWSSTRGRFLQFSSGGSEAKWLAPTALGMDTVTATVTDGKAKKSASVWFQVGTLWRGDIAGSRSWSKSFSPYILDPPSGIFEITENSVLVIGSGVTVYVKPRWARIDVLGALQIMGTPDAPVVIRPLAKHPPRGYWEGILVNPGQVVARWANVSYAEDNIKVFGSSDVVVENSKLEFAMKSGVHYEGSSTFIIRKCNLVDNSGNGLTVRKIIATSLPASIVVDSCSIQFNGGSGVEINIWDDYAVVPVTIENCDIAFNSVHGVKLAKASYPRLRGNSIHDNDLTRTAGGFGLYCEPFAWSGLVDTLDARGNYWGASFGPADTTMIDRLMIYDKKDDSVLPRAHYSPWLNQPPVVDPAGSVERWPR